MTNQPERERKKDREEKIFREFLKAAGFKARNVKPGETPDFKATVYNDIESIKVGVELTENLPPKGSSPGQKLKGAFETFCRHVQNLQPNYPNLANHIEASVNFNRGMTPKKTSAERLAQEFLEFLSANLDELTVPGSCRYLIRSQKDKFPLVWKHIGVLRLWKHDFEEPMNLSCPLADGAWTDLVSQKLLEIICNKAGKKYDRQGIEELWLLIHGGGESIHSSFTEVKKAMAPEVINCLRKSGFQRVYMWEESKNQPYCIWPQD